MPNLKTLLEERRRIQDQLKPFEGRSLMASEQRTYDRLVETRSQIGDQIDAAAVQAPASRTLQYVQNNLATRATKVAELRAIDAAAVGRPYSAQEKATTDELRSEVGEIDGRVAGMLETALRGQEMDDATGRLGRLHDDTTGPGDTVRRPGIGKFEARSDDIRQLFEEVRGGMNTAQMEYRAVTAYPTVTHQDAVGHVPMRREPTRLAAYMPTQQVNSATANYWAASAAASAAATVAPGAQKPESTPGWTSVTANIRKIAHWTEVPVEALDDYPSFEQIVQEEMTAGLIATENAQLASGDGIGTNILGLTNTVGIQVYAPAAEARGFSVLHAATMVRTGSAYLEADTVIMHPTDWETVQTWSATGGELIASNPANATQMTLWGLKVVTTTGLAAGTALVGALAPATVVFSREAPIVKVDPYSGSTRNMVKFISEERLTLGVIRPTGLVKVTFGGTT